MSDDPQAHRDARLTPRKETHLRLLLDALIVVGGAGLVVLASRYGLEAGHPATRGTGAILGGFYGVYLGAMFLLSAFFPEACYTFSFLSYICQACSHPAGGWMAFIYSGLCLIAGSCLLLIGLGVL